MRISAILLASVLVLLTFYGVSAQAPGPAPTDTCLVVLLNASDCLSWLTPGSTEASPGEICCQEFASVVDNQPLCLCQLFNLSYLANYGLSIDTSKALETPRKCGILTPPISFCAEVGIPVPPEALPPGAPAPSILAVPPIAAVPPTRNTGNQACYIGGSSLGLLANLAIAFVSAFF